MKLKRRKEEKERERQEMERGKTDSHVTGKQGQILLKGGKTEGLRVPLIIEEQCVSYFTRVGKKIEDGPLSGVIKIKNPSTRDRLWDVYVSLKNIIGTSLGQHAARAPHVNLDEAEFSFKEIIAGQLGAIEYNIKAATTQKHLEVTEFVSTQNGSGMESYTLKAGKDNAVYFRITVKNVSGAKVTAIQVTKGISTGFSNVKITRASVGTGKLEEGNVIWIVEELDCNVEATLELHVTVNINDINVRVKSGPVGVSYKVPTAISGVAIDKFHAHSNHRFFLELGELEKQPGTFNCHVIFHNTSEFMVQLVKVNVYDPMNDQNKIIEVVPNEVPPLPAGAEWASSNRLYTIPEPNAEPEFRKECEFFIDWDPILWTIGTIIIDEVEFVIGDP